MKKIAIFGAGYFGIQLYFQLKNDNEIVAFFDNDKSLWGQMIYNVPILHINEVNHISYDQIYITPLKYYNDINDQLVEYGVSREKICLDWIQGIDDHRIEEENKRYKEKIIKGLYLYQDGYKKEEYEKRWEDIKNKYTSINIFRMRESSIGELISRVLAFIHERQDKDKKCLNVILPEMDDGEDRICNKELISLINQKVYFPEGEEILFWAYIFKNHQNDLNTKLINKYYLRNSYPAYKVRAYNNSFTFPVDKANQAEEKMKQMGIRRPYVCIAARSDGYNKATLRNASIEDEYIYRNMNFDDFNAAIHFLERQGIQAVRMGRGELPIDEPMNNLIDYAGGSPQDFMDLYLVANSKGVIINTIGLIAIASLFAIPVLMVNTMPFSFGFGGFQHTEMDMFIPKKYYSNEKKRYISLLEMAELEKDCLIWWSKYKALDVRYDNNTEKEILDATEEFISRIDGKCKEDKQIGELARDVENRMEIIKKQVKSNEKIWIGEPIAYQICRGYLKKNKYLLA